MQVKMEKTRTGIFSTSVKLYPGSYEVNRLYLVGIQIIFLISIFGLSFVDKIHCWWNMESWSNAPCGSQLRVWEQQSYRPWFCIAAASFCSCVQLLILLINHICLFFYEHISQSTQCVKRWKFHLYFRVFLSKVLCACLEVHKITSYNNRNYNWLWTHITWTGLG